MRKILFLLLFMLPQSALAFCHTGFACSIKDLQMAEYLSAINNYFSKNAHEINYITGKMPVDEYNDLFTFSTIV